MPPLRRAALCLLLAPALACAEPPSAPRDGDATRIVVMAPMAAEILVELGCEGRIVGAGDWVTWPPAVAALPKVGAYQAPNLERVLELEADLFVSTASQAATPAHGRLRDLGVEVLELDGDTVAGVYAGIAALGGRLGREARAAEVVAAIRARLAAVGERVAGLPRPRVLVAVGADPLFVAAPGSTIHEMLELAGGENVVAGPGPAYRQLSLEVALERLPELVVDTSDNRPGALRGRTPGPWGEWPFLPAVAEDRVFWVDPLRLVINGPRLPEIAELLGRILHPEVFGAPSTADLAAPAGAPG